MEMLGCYASQMNLGPVKNCSIQNNASSFQDCVSEYDSNNFDNFMLFFGQIEPICQYLNDTSPIISAEAIIEVALFQLPNFILLLLTEHQGEFKRRMGFFGEDSVFLCDLIKFHTVTKVNLLTFPYISMSNS